MAVVDGGGEEAAVARGDGRVGEDAGGDEAALAALGVLAAARARLVACTPHDSLGVRF